MQDWIEKLLLVQQLDLRMAKLQELADSVPAEKAKADDMLAADDEAAAAARAELQEAEKALKRISLEADGLEQKKTDFQAKSTMIKNNDEYRAAMSQIEKCDHQIALSDEKRHAAQVEIEAVTRKIALVKEHMSATELRVAERKKDLDVRASNCEDELKKLQSARPAIIAAVEKAQGSRYERLRKRMSALPDQRVLVPVVNEVCDKCRMNATAQVRMNARKGMLVCCENCGAMLYTND